MRVRFLGGGHGNPLQSSCLENPMDRGAWGYRPWGREESDTTERQTLSLRIKLAGSKFGSLETGEGGEDLRTRKQRVKFAKFRAVEPQRAQRNGSGFRLTLRRMLLKEDPFPGVSLWFVVNTAPPALSSSRYSNSAPVNDVVPNWAVMARLSRLRPGAGLGGGGASAGFGLTVRHLAVRCKPRHIQLFVDKGSARSKQGHERLL